MWSEWVPRVYTQPIRKINGREWSLSINTVLTLRDEADSKINSNSFGDVIDLIRQSRQAGYCRSFWVQRSFSIALNPKPAHSLSQDDSQVVRFSARSFDMAHAGVAPPLYLLLYNFVMKSFGYLLIRDRMNQPMLFQDQISNCTNVLWLEPNQTTHADPHRIRPLSYTQM